jgi:hypothetical protein
VNSTSAQQRRLANADVLVVVRPNSTNEYQRCTAKAALDKTQRLWITLTKGAFVCMSNVTKIVFSLCGILFVNFHSFKNQFCPLPMIFRIRLCPSIANTAGIRLRATKSQIELCVEYVSTNKPINTDQQ